MKHPSEKGPDPQGIVTAIHLFSDRHDKHEIPQDQKTYRDLIPSKQPGVGEQYAFEVDMDKCTGCKACVTACHNENGLDIDETWRTVGLVQGGNSENPVIQHVTSACHHCIDPACLKGCPTLAYKKDPVSGVVIHLDDQCFGCQYCILKCPYDVPKYSSKRGIVHKCDMCIGRLNKGQAPACARACPNDAIRIVLVDKAEVVKNSADYVRIADAPSSTYTHPTTKYKTSRTFPANMESTDYYDVKPEHAHTPLVFMLVLTQLSFGSFFARFISEKFFGFYFHGFSSSLHALFSLALGFLALGASLFHLGRPHLAFRALLGLRTSWLSREILSFGIFAKVALAYAAFLWFEPLRNRVVSIIGVDVTPVLEGLVLFSGAIGVFCSVKVYQDTKRPYWDHPTTLFKFFATSLILGFGALLFTSSAVVVMDTGSSFQDIIGQTPNRMIQVILISSIIKLLVELSLFFHLKWKALTYFQKTAILMTGVLKHFTQARFFCGVMGGAIIPCMLLFTKHPYQPTPVLFVISMMLIFLIMGEWLERYLFFRAVVPLKMPAGSQI